MPNKTQPSPALSPAQARNDNAIAWQKWSFWLMAAVAACAALWELKIAPIRPGGSWAALKALPAAVAAPFLLYGKHRAFFFSAILASLYLCEGVMRLFDSNFASVAMAGIQSVLAIACYCSLFYYCRRCR